MESKEKKMAAALAAVAAFMQQEEEALHQQLTVPVAPVDAPAPSAGMNLWGQSGRQSMMQMRHLMQFRALHR